MGWQGWLIIGLLGWIVLPFPVLVLVGRFLGHADMAGTRSATPERHLIAVTLDDTDHGLVLDRDHPHQARHATPG